MTEHDVVVGLVGPLEPFGKRETLEGFLDEVMEHLQGCDVIDPVISESYSSDGESVTIEFAMTVQTGEPDAAVSRAMNAIRASFHTLGAATPGWEDVIRKMQSSVRATSGDGDLIEA